MSKNLPLIICSSLVFFVFNFVSTVLAQSEANLTVIQWSSSGDYIAAGFADGMLRVWNVHTQKVIWEVQAHESMFYSITWNPDDTRLATASAADEVINIWNAKTGILVTQLPCDHSELGLVFVKWSPTGEFLASIASGEVWPLRLWKSFEDQYQLLEATDSYSIVYDLEWSSDGSRLIVAEFNGVFLIEDITSERFRQKVVAPLAIDVAWGAGNSLSIVDAESGEIHVMDVQTTETLAVLQRPAHTAADAPYTVVWSPDGQYLAIDNRDGTLQIWHPYSENNTQTFVSERVAGRFLVSWSPYGGRLALGSAVGMSAARQTNTAVMSTISGSQFQIIVPTPSLDRLNAIAELCVRDATTQSRAVTGLTSQRVTSLNALPDFIAQVESLPEGAIPAACRADLLAVVDALR